MIQAACQDALVFFFLVFLSSRVDFFLILVSLLDLELWSFSKDIP